MKRSRPAILLLAVLGFTIAQAQPAMPTIPVEQQPSSRVVDANGLALFLKDLQPKTTREVGGRLEVVAAYLSPALVGSFDAMAHGWCENPVFLGCGATHFPINLTILTGESSKEFFRVPASERFLAIPGGLSRHAAPVYLLKKPPSNGVWLAWGRKPGEEFVISGPLVNGTGATATIVKAATVATVMHGQMFITELTRQSTRWKL